MAETAVKALKTQVLDERGRRIDAERRLRRITCHLETLKFHEADMREVLGLIANEVGVELAKNVDAVHQKLVRRSDKYGFNRI